MQILSHNTVLKRINRKLAAGSPGEFLRVKKTRSIRAQLSLGQYYLLDGRHNLIVDHHLYLNEVAKQHKVLSSAEQVEQ